ncbi:ARP8 [Candida pseudojiufengensis]|uniref:ARP8 n=1 Tax=Candida pseudojiufengensis TaxID=497109 RepID=UPI002224703B|nr:ARP8 [Candida pseudojiufengensis]KAI5966338.1 ARP8 [Candida pseudojiufengensis]
MSESLNPPTSPPDIATDPPTPLPSSQADFNLHSEPPEEPEEIENGTKQDDEEHINKKQKPNSTAATTETTPVPTSSTTTTTNPPKKTSAEQLKRRRENRQKAAAALAQNLKNSGVARYEQENGFGLTSIKPIALLNQKNYYTEYLKKDEQVSFIRNWRYERDLAAKLKKLKQSGGNEEEIKKNLEEIKNFDDFDLNNIENELKKKTDVVVDDDDDDDEEGENETEEVRQEKAKIGEDVIVLQPGSTYIRIGRATDAVPKIIPNVIAVRNNKPKLDVIAPERHIDEEHDKIIIDEDFDEQRALVSKDFRARMRFYKRRIIPNSRETVAGYNKKQESEKIPDHNDPNKKEWIKPDSSKKFYAGEDALKLILEDGWNLRYPMINANFNEYSKDYKSRQEILGDLTNIIKDSLQKLLDINDVSNLKVMLIIPDLYDKTYVETWSDLLLRFVGFGKLGILQEAVAATFGAGASTACIVDVGAQTTKISCVDEGMIINDSRILLRYGGDNITETFVKLILENWFPYKDINLLNSYDWELAKNLKEQFITFQDADIAVQLYNFYKRNPFQQTEKFEFKIFDEVMLAPMGLFFPQLFQLQKIPKKNKSSNPSIFSSTKPSNIRLNHLFPKALDQYSGKSSNPKSKSQDKLKTNLNYCDLDERNLLLRLIDNDNEEEKEDNNNLKKIERFNNNLNLNKTPIEKAIVESITNASLSSDISKMKKFYDNILIVGGGLAKINGYDLILADRINIWRPKFLSTTSFDSIMDHLTSEVRKNTLKKRELLDEAIKEAKEAKQLAKEEEAAANGEDPQPEPPQQQQDEEEIELSQEILDSIDSQTELNLDINYYDQISEEGNHIPINILPTPREFDPSMLTWKGGSVYSRLKVVNEMWINQKDWDLLGSRSLYYKSIFNY